MEVSMATVLAMGALTPFASPVLLSRLLERDVPIDNELFPHVNRVRARPPHPREPDKAATPPHSARRSNLQESRPLQLRSLAVRAGSF
uniref:Uncharacterized protein n=1 Tax=Oryza glumipatula TaxID=40148 RepID=A0A0E0AVC9_9ORYZ